MTSYITGAAPLVGPASGLDVLFDYKVRCPSGNRKLAKMSAHIHLKPTTPALPILTLSYRSLRSSRRSIRNGCKRKVRKVVSMYFGKFTHRKTERSEQGKGISTRWSASCGRVVCGGSGSQTVR